MLAELSQNSSAQNAKAKAREKIEDDDFSEIDDECLEIEGDKEGEEEIQGHIRRQSRATIRRDRSPSNISAGSPMSVSKEPIENKSEKSELTIEEALSKIEMIISSKQEKGAKPYQEDSTCIFYSPDLTVLMGAVFDGHGGINGQIASKKLANLTLEYFQKNWQKIRDWTKEEWKKEMKSWFDEMQTTVRDCFAEMERVRRRNNGQSEENIVDSKGVVRKSSGMPIHGGTTATIATAIRQPKNTWQLVCANVGDSDCLLVARKPQRLASNNDVYMHMSVDHSPDSRSEYLRIKELESKDYPQKLLFVYDQDNAHCKYECPLVFLENGTKDPKYANNPWKYNLRPTNVRYDPAVYAVSPSGVSHDITCIAMTRSLGDFYANQFGLSHRPDLTFHQLDAHHQCFITVASDGIWDCWKWDAFAEYLNTCFIKFQLQTQQVVHVALQHTVARAKSCFGHSSFDDASLVVISLLPQLFPSLPQPVPNRILPPLTPHPFHHSNVTTSTMTTTAAMTTTTTTEAATTTMMVTTAMTTTTTETTTTTTPTSTATTDTILAATAKGLPILHDDNDSEFGKHDDGEELFGSFSD
ncbi:hypothetical protein RFI_09521 [Reticulomyxa filosa]|uniref:PPM-type phosphatase domain-containing protein n=1 Tax=Reticulomyxa filosa TaxID=46433 RepID=X6NQG6_RETFI|nr:hypothetical protein RFI_09521 [Reticulomyxa filosa]|eukprot:ETO27612.1 hypothetical protein RFI_09521 [Reticulomyxa filosa]